MKNFFALLFTVTVMVACNNAADTTTPAEDHTTTEPQVDTIPPNDTSAANIDSVIKK